MGRWLLLSRINSDEHGLELNGVLKGIVYSILHYQHRTLEEMP